MTNSPKKRLAAHKMSLDAIPLGGGLMDALQFFSDGARAKRSAAESKKWVDDAIAAVRGAGDPNPWKTETDDAIAAELLRRIGETSKARLVECGECRADLETDQ